MSVLFCSLSFQGLQQMAGRNCGYTIRSAYALNYVVENVTVSLHYWYHACDETLDGQAAQLAAYFCRLHCVFHLTVHVGSILIFLNVAYTMHYDVFTWMPIQNNKGAFTWHGFGYMWNKVWIFCHYKPSVSSILPFAIHCRMALGLQRATSWVDDITNPVCA